MKLAMGAQWWLSVRVRLVLFALLCAVPMLLLLTALQFQTDVQQLHRHAAEEAKVLTDRMAVRMALVLGAAESVAEAMTALDLSRGAPPGCSEAMARAVRAAGPFTQNLSLSNAAGDVLCSARPVGGRINAADRVHLRQALESREPVLSGLVFGRITGKPVLVLSVPILSAEGRVLGGTTAVLNAEALTGGLLNPVDDRTNLSLFDREGVLVSHSPALPNVPPGTRLRDGSLFRHAVAGGGYSALVQGVDGSLQHFITRPLAYRGKPAFWIAAGIDVDALEAEARAARWRELLLVLMVTGGVVGLAVLATRPVVLARVRAMTDVARQAAEGRYGSRVPLTVNDELRPVEGALNHMLDAIEADRAVLAASENRFRLLFEHSLDGVLQNTPEGKVLAANPAACRMLGRSEDQLRGMSRSELMDPRDERVQALIREREQNGQARGEITMLRGDGSPLEVEIASSIYHDSRGQPNVCVVIHDVTERKAAQEQALRMNRELEARVARRTRQLQAANAELEAFSYSVSHDLRAPVAVVRAFAEVLDENEAVQGEKNQHYLSRIRAAGLHMNELIDGLLLLANISRSQLEWSLVDVSALARETVQELADAHALRRPKVDVTPGMHAMGDARLLRVLLQNLIGNAMKFSAKQPVPRVSVGFAPSTMGEQVFCVRDNGDGFDPAQAHRLFVAFQRLHTVSEFPGVGIGLATVQRIVQRHGGRIWAESKPGAGAAFFFALGAHGSSLSRQGAPEATTIQSLI